MTTALDVDEQVYYDAATALSTAATAFFRAVDGKWGALSECGEMCGSYEEARKWATSYDTRSESILQSVTLIAEAASNYANVLQQIGYNYELAEHTATMSAGGEPARPAALPPAAYLCRIPLPSAGGSGGLVEALKLVEAIGITVPDGNATKLTNMSNTWRDIATAASVAGFVAELDRIATMFDGLAAPELAFIGEDLRHIRDDAQAVVSAASELATSCQAHRTALDGLREALKHELETLGEELVKELAITYAIGLAASALTFGIGVAVASARAVQIAAKFGRPLRLLIEGWKTEKNIGRGVDTLSDVAKNQKELQRLRELGAVRAPAKLSNTEATAITDYTGSGHQFANIPLRSGKITAEQQRYIDDLNAGLSKLPDYRGPVSRVTELTPEQLAKYQKGGNITEEAFTSTSPARAGGGVREGNVEFQIFSQTGKDITQYSAPGNPEILFKSGTPFQVTNRYTDWNTGRTVIQMVEKTS
ncbi:ADP-ribosyltransferase domain-containing protein [Nocardia sp. NPDC057440]|uniref:ADP-ribosyltransferase domain-containing protein n=1 Tax=Nocardia sp. NPDC057440 TaxID=3346134 RepID=UPI00366F6456